MRDRPRAGRSARGAIRLGACLLSLLALRSAPAQAALERYRLTTRSVVSSPNVSPNPDVALPRVAREASVARIDAAPGPQPVLRRFLRAVDATRTEPVPGLTGQIFLSNNFREGPGAVAALHGAAPPAFTGSGSVGGSIAWGVVTGWSASGSFWCNSSPALVCALAMGVDEGTSDPRFNSEFYDLGTWVFHGSGFTGTPFLSSYSPSDFGNTLLWVRGRNAPDGSLPALPALGAVSLSASLIAAGIALLRNRPGGC